MNGMHYIELGPIPGYVGFCFDEKPFAKEMKRLAIKDPPRWLNEGAHGTCHSFEHPTDGLTILVCMNGALAKKKKPIAVIELMVHECTHVWQRLREFMNEHTPSAEFEAYTMGYLVQQCLIAYGKWK